MRKLKHTKVIKIRIQNYNTVSPYLLKKLTKSKKKIVYDTTMYLANPIQIAICVPCLLAETLSHLHSTLKVQ